MSENGVENNPVVIVGDADGVRLVTFNRPDKLNAFDQELYNAVTDALVGAATNPDVSVVVLTGAGRAFSAGQDLGEMARLSTPEARAEGSGTAAAGGHGFVGLLAAVTTFPKPLLAAVNGLGVGLGLTLLPHCDLVLIAESARLKAPFVSLGVAPEAAGSYTLPATMGWQAAALALFTTDWIDATTAVATGLALRTAPDDMVLTETLLLARRIAAMPLVSLVETKQLMLAAKIDQVRAARTREDEVFGRLTGADANREALESFLGGS
jgi:enoyl-CoA hydratase/carnithine racemase